MEMERRQFLRLAPVAGAALAGAWHNRAVPDSRRNDGEHGDLSGQGASGVRRGIRVYQQAEVPADAIPGDIWIVP